MYKKIAIGLMLLTGLAGAALAEHDATPDSLEAAAVHEAMLRLYIHGVTDELANEVLGPEAVPHLRKLLTDPGFPQRDNVVAFLAHLDRGDSVDALLAHLEDPIGDPDLPEDQRALWLVPEALGWISRYDNRALVALLTFVDTDSGHVPASRIAWPLDTEQTLHHMALRGLAVSGSEAARRKLQAIAAGVNPQQNSSAERIRSASVMLELTSDLDSAADSEARADSEAGGQDIEQTGPDPQGSGSTSESLDTWTWVGDLELEWANHVNVPSTNDVEDTLVNLLATSASNRFGRDDAAGSDDVACCVTFSNGVYQGLWGTGGDGLSVIDNDSELDTVINWGTARVKVVNIINYCSGPGTNILGCGRTNGWGIAVVPLGGSDQDVRIARTGILWSHELGHNVGRAHSLDNLNIMSPTVNSDGSNDRVTQSQCNSYHTLNIFALTIPSNVGVCEDNDVDNVHDFIDNCEDDSNFSQVNSDNDPHGDACDNCPTVINPNQTNSDGDSLGNSCDNCDTVSNESQTNSDGDGLGDACDNCAFDSNSGQQDADGDTVGDVCDNCPNVSNTNQNDYGDGDGVGNACDNCFSDDNPDQSDVDGDTHGDVCDNCPSTANPSQADWGDGDGVGNDCDNCLWVDNPNQADYDNDTFGDACDNCPLVYNYEQDDLDSDLVGDYCDNCLNTVNADQSDADADTVGDACDNCPDDYNPNQRDWDNDGEADACDPDCGQLDYTGSISVDWVQHTTCPGGTTGGECARIDWSAEGETYFDVMRGDLDELRSTGGDFYQAMAVIGPPRVCVSNNTTALFALDSGHTPDPERNYFYLMRAIDPCGTNDRLDSGGPGQIGPRDTPALDTSTWVCNTP